MKIGKKLKRICAAAMASVIGLTGWQILLPDLVEAASGYYVQFSNLNESENRDYSDYAEVVAGGIVDTIKITPPFYEYSSNAFKVISATDMADQPITPPNDPIYTTMTSDKDRNAIIHANVLDKDGSIVTTYDPQNEYPETVYNIEPVFHASLDRSTVGSIKGITYRKDPNGGYEMDPTGTKPKEYVENLGVTATVEGGGRVSIIQISTLTITFNRDEKNPGEGTHQEDDDNGVNRKIIGDLTVTGTGDFADYNMVDPDEASTKTNLVLNINASQGSGHAPISLSIPLSNSAPYQEGTEISLTFRPERFRPIRLRVIPPKVAVDRLADEILENFEDFVEFTKAGENRLNITSTFKLKQTVIRYNFKKNGGFFVQWEWDTEVEAAKKSLNIYQEKDPYDPKSPEVYTSADVIQPLDDASGKLKATVYYTSTDGKVKCQSKTVEIGVVIRGEGIQPTIEAVSAIRGYYDETEGRRADQDITYEVFPDAHTFPTYMDAYNGSVRGWKPEEDSTRQAYRVTGRLNFGTGVSVATKAKITVTGTGGMDVFLADDPTTPYDASPDSTAFIENPSKTGPESHKSFTLWATSKGVAKVTIQFYNATGGEYGEPLEHSFIIDYSGPSSNAQMKKIDVIPIIDATADEATQGRFNEVYKEGLVDIAFDKDKTDYRVPLPWAVEKIKLQPKYDYESEYNGDIFVEWDDGYRKGSASLKSDGSEQTPEIPLTIERAMTIHVNGVAEDKTKTPVYTLTVTRASKSNNNFLKGLSAITREDKVEHIENPDLEMQYIYSFSLPYSYHDKPLDIKATTQNDWASKPEITVEPKEAESRSILARIQQFFNSSEKTIYPKCVRDEETKEWDGRNTVSIKVKSESGMELEYIVNVIIEDPSEDSDLIQLDVYRQETGEPLSFDNKIVFTKEGLDYYLTVPYSTQQLRFDLLPNDEKATLAWIQYPEVYRKENGVTGKDGWEERRYSQKGTPISKVVKIPFSDPIQDAEKKFAFRFDVTAESEDRRDIPYTVHIERAEPDIDARLASMTVTDADTEAPVENFSFNPQKLEYDFTVPFTTTNVVVTPVAQSALSKVMVDDAGISETYPGRTIQLREGVVTTVNVKVTPEGGTKFEQTYVLRIRRELPSTDARLQSLVVNGGENMTPVPFIPAHTTYNVNIPEGTPGYTITAVPVEPHATITIDGKAVENGQPSQNIVSTTGNSRIRIVVTAQDGRTTKTYTLNVRDYNLIKKGSDATLASLGVNYGDLQPSFRPNRENYELYVKPDAMGLDLTPELSDGRAAMKVYSGTRQLTAYDGVYSGSLIEEENIFTIDVTAEDGTTTSSYTLTVYKNDEEKQGHMKPISADVVDFSENPIVIDITNYAVIDASVFNTLKVDYPDKTIIFQGNDYTLQMRGTDIAGLVPYNETYDLKLLFTTPEENQIRDALWDLNADPRQYLEDLEPVFIYFDDHTALPGKMLLTVHLGRAYSNDQLYWNYYNSERDRLDYYGYVRSNAQGSFSVAINHFSTYIITKERIIGAESKVGLTYGGASTTATGAADGSAGGDPNKVNPQTGVQTGGSE